MFDWMKKVIAAVPADWKPELETIRSNETLLGPVPEDLLGAYRASLYGVVLSRKVREQHESEDHAIPLIDKQQVLGMVMALNDKCKHTQNIENMIKSRAVTLRLATLESIREIYDVPPTHEFAIREEGVVSWPSKNATDERVALLNELREENSSLADLVTALFI